MIVRVWHGWTKPQNAAAYETLLKTEIFHAIEAKGIDGFLGMDLLTRSMIDFEEFVTIMRFSSIEAVKAFAGENYELAVVPPEARKLLDRFDERSQHYELKVENGRVLE